MLSFNQFLSEEYDSEKHDAFTVKEEPFEARRQLELYHKHGKPGCLRSASNFDLEKIATTPAKHNQPHSDYMIHVIKAIEDNPHEVTQGLNRLREMHANHPAKVEHDEPPEMFHSYWNMDPINPRHVTTDEDGAPIDDHPEKGHSGIPNIPKKK